MGSRLEGRLANVVVGALEIGAYALSLYLIKQAFGEVDPPFWIGIAYMPIGAFATTDSISRFVFGRSVYKLDVGLVPATETTAPGVKGSLEESTLN